MLKLLAIVLALVSSLAAMTSPAAAARVAVLLTAKAPEYEEALKGFKEATPHEIVAVYDMDGDLDRGGGGARLGLLLVVGGGAAGGEQRECGDRCKLSP